MQETHAHSTTNDDLEPKRLDNILAPMVQPSGAGKSRLESLPNELLMAIFEELAHEEHLSFSSLKDTSTVISAYYNACLVSKRIYLVVRPSMYKRISISDFPSLARLCRTISEDQELGHTISEMTINVLFHGICSRDMKPLTPDEEAEVLNDCYQVIGSGKRQELSSQNREGELIGILCYELLARTVNLWSMTMVVHSWRDYTHALLRTPTLQSYAAFFDRVKSTNRPGANVAVTVFLPRLENLALETPFGTVPHEMFQHFMGLPSLRKVTSIKDGACWTHSVPRGGQMASQGTGNIHVFKYWAIDRDLKDMAHLFPTLEVLSVSVSSYINKSFWHPTAISQLHTNLSVRSSLMTSLRTLKIKINPSIRFTYHFHDYINHGTIQSPGPRMVLDLTSVSNLRELELPSFSVAHLLPSGSDGTTVAPSNVLPRALESLVLVAQRHCLHPDGRDCWDSLPAALGFLESLGRDLSSFQRLKTVAHCSHPNSCANPARVTTLPSQDDDGPDGSGSPEPYEYFSEFSDSFQDPPPEVMEDSPEGTTHSRLVAVHDLYSTHSVDFCLQKMTSELEREAFDLDQWK